MDIISKNIPCCVNSNFCVDGVHYESIRLKGAENDCVAIECWTHYFGITDPFQASKWSIWELKIPNEVCKQQSFDPFPCNMTNTFLSRPVT